MAIPTQTDAFARAEIDQATAVFHLLSGPLETAWLDRVRPDAVSLVPFYGMTQYRNDVYTLMVSHIMDAVEPGGRLAVVHYGHPLFASTVSQMLFQRGRDRDDVIVRARPGISAADCLFADIGFDPVIEGVLILDASRYAFDPPRAQLGSVSLVLLQLGVTGDPSVQSFTSALEPDLRALKKRLVQGYGPDHMVVLYEASVHVAYGPRIDWCRVDELDGQEITMATTLFVPADGWRRASY